MSKLDKLKAHIQRWGWRRTSYALMMRAVSKFPGLEIVLLRARETPDEVSGSQSALPGFTIRQISEEELRSSVDDSALPLSDVFVGSAMDRGDFAFGAFQDGRLIAYVWRAVGPAPHYDDCWVRVASHCSYSYNSFARPEFRGQHIVPALTLYSDHEMQKQGYTHRVGIVAPTNFASLEMSKYIDSRNIGHAGFVKWFGRYYFFHSGSAAEIGFQFFQPSRLQAS